MIYLWDADYPWDVRTEKICRTLNDSGFAMHIVARNRRWDVAEEALPEGTVHRLRPWRWVGQRFDGVLQFPAFLNPRWAHRLGTVVAKTAPAAIVVRDLPLCPVAIGVGRRHHLPVIFDMAENYPALLRDVWDTGRQQGLDWLVRNPNAAVAVERYCLPRVDHVLVVVEESKARIQELGVPSDRITLVSNTPPRSRAQASRPHDKESPRLVLVYMGLMELARGLDTLLHAIARLNEQGSNVFLQMIGGGRDLGLLQERAQILGLGESQVRFHGYIPSHADALEIVGGADVGVIPHLANDWANTTIPNKLFDYMAAGIPVLTSDSKPCSRIVRQTGCGVVFRAADVDSLVEAVRRLASPKDRKRLGAAGISAVLEALNWEADTSRLRNALEATLKRG